MANIPAIPIRSALLVSDVHLNQDQPQLAQAFFTWLDQHTLLAAQLPQTVFILGDLVDAWVGDDQLTNQPSSSVDAQLCDHLRAIKQAGITTYFLHGNRDFLIGAEFAAATGIQLLSDPTQIEIQREGRNNEAHQKDYSANHDMVTKRPGDALRIVLSHGDQLCTQDSAYQAFRKQVRDPQWQAAFLAKPLAERLQIAQHLRAQSEIEKSGKAMEIMDITQAEADRLVAHSHADTLIHGHTHRPGHYPLQHSKDRWVLPDWETDDRGKLIRGGGLYADSQGIRPVSI